MEMRKIGSANPDKPLSQMSLWRHIEKGICPEPFTTAKSGRFPARYWTEEQAEKYSKNRFGEINQ